MRVTSCCCSDKWPFERLCGLPSLPKGLFREGAAAPLALGGMSSSGHDKILLMVRMTRTKRADTQQKIVQQEMHPR